MAKTPSTATGAREPVLGREATINALTRVSSPSSSKICTTDVGHGFPTDPGLRSHSSALIAVPPPSVAA